MLRANKATQFADEKTLIDDASKIFKKDIIDALFSGEKLSFVQLNNIRKNLNAYTKALLEKRPSFQNTLSLKLQSELRTAIDNAIKDIFRQNPVAFAKASELYETALKDYANMKGTLKVIDDLRANNAKSWENNAVKALIDFAKGQGEENLTNLARLTRHLTPENRAVIEMNILNGIFEKSRFVDEMINVDIFDSGAFLKRLEKLTGKNGEKAVFESTQAKEMIAMVNDFHTLFKKDADIARRLSPARSNDPTRTPNMATTASGKVAMMRIKLLFEFFMRNMPEVFWLPKAWNEGVKGAALRFHLRHALSRSNSVAEFKQNFSEAVKRSPHTTQAQKIIKEMNEAFDEMANLSNDLSKMSDDELFMLEKFGKNYAEFKGKGQEAIDHLLKTKSGQVQGAWQKQINGQTHDIALVWGEAGTGKSDGYGLAKIIKYHPEAVNELDNVIKNGTFFIDEKRRPNFKLDNKIVGLRDNWQGEKTPFWIISSYTKGDEFGKGIDSAKSINTSKENYSFATHQNNSNTNQAQSQAPQNTKKSILDLARENTDPKSQVLAKYPAQKQEIEALQKIENNLENLAQNQIKAYENFIYKNDELKKMQNEMSAKYQTEAEFKQSDDYVKSEKLSKELIQARKDFDNAKAEFDKKHDEFITQSRKMGIDNLYRFEPLHLQDAEIFIKNASKDELKKELDNLTDNKAHFENALKNESQNLAQDLNNLREVARLDERIKIMSKGLDEINKAVEATPSAPASNEIINQNGLKLDKAREFLEKNVNFEALNAEQKGIFEVLTGKKDKIILQGKDTSDLYTLESGSRNAGVKKILIKHAGLEKTGGVSNDELLNMMNVVRNGEINKDSFALFNDRIRYAYDLDENGVNLRLVVDEYNDGRKVFDFYSDRNFIGDNKPDLPSPDRDAIPNTEPKSQALEKSDETLAPKMQTKEDINDIEYTKHYYTDKIDEIKSEIKRQVELINAHQKNLTNAKGKVNKEFYAEQILELEARKKGLYKDIAECRKFIKKADKGIDTMNRYNTIIKAHQKEPNIHNLNELYAVRKELYELIEVFEFTEPTIQKPLLTKAQNALETTLNAIDDTKAFIKYKGQMKDTPNKIQEFKDYMQELRDGVDIALSFGKEFVIKHLDDELNKATNKIQKDFINRLKKEVENYFKAKEQAPSAKADESANLSINTTPKAKISEIRANAKAKLDDLVQNKTQITNKNDGRVAQISGEGRKKIFSAQAVKQSTDNGFKAAEHFEASSKLKELYENSVFEASEPPRNNSQDIKAVHRYVANVNINGKDAQALLTLKENARDEIGNRIYSLELQELRPLPNAQARTKQAQQGQSQLTLAGDTSAKSTPEAIAKTDKYIIPNSKGRSQVSDLIVFESLFRSAVLKLTNARINIDLARKAGNNKDFQKAIREKYRAFRNLDDLINSNNLESDEYFIQKYGINKLDKELDLDDYAKSVREIIENDITQNAKASQAQEIEALKNVNINDLKSELKSIERKISLRNTQERKIIEKIEDKFIDDISTNDIKPALEKHPNDKDVKQLYKVRDERSKLYEQQDELKTKINKASKLQKYQLSKEQFEAWKDKTNLPFNDANIWVIKQEYADNGAMTIKTDKYIAEKYLKANPKSPLTEQKVYDRLSEIRDTIQSVHNINPLKEFGTNYAEFYKDGAGAIKKLLAEAEAAKKAGVEFNGQVAGAFEKEIDGVLSDIDLVWGNEKFGLAHITQKHPDLDLNLIPQIVEKGEVVENAGVKTIIYKDGQDEFRVGLSKGFNGKGENEWILTAYQRSHPAQNFDQVADKVQSGNNLFASGNADIIPQNQTKINFLPRLEKMAEYQQSAYRFLGRLDDNLGFEFTQNLPQEVRDRIYNTYIKRDASLKDDFRIDGDDIFIGSKITPQKLNEAINELLQTPQLQKDELFFNTKAKFKNFSDKKVADLLEFMKDSDSFTKDKNGVPKEFYHGGAKDIQAFENDKSGYGYFFSSVKDEAMAYREDTYSNEGFYKTFLKMNNPFRMDKITLNSFDEYKKALQNVGTKDITKADYEIFLENKRFFNEIKQKAQENGFKLSEMDATSATFINGKKQSHFMKLYNDPTYPAISSLFKDIKPLNNGDVWFGFNNFARNEFDLTLLSVNNKGVSEYSTSGALDNFKDILQRQGYDSIIFNDFQVSVFNSNQIKEVKNTGSWTDSAGNISKSKPKDKSATHSFFNEQSPNILMSNDAVGGAVLGGSLNGIETDENGDFIGFNPQKALYGAAAGAAGVKGLKYLQKLATKYPRAKVVLNKIQVKNDIIPALKQGKKMSEQDIIKALENSPQKGRDMLVIGKENLSEKVLEWALKNNKKVAVDILPDETAKKFGFKYPNVKRTIGASEVKHTLERHGENSQLVKHSGQKPVTLADMRKWTDYADEAEFYTTSKDNSGQEVLLSAKQINGFYVVIESIRKKYNELGFKTMYFEKGNLFNHKDFKKFKKTLG